MKRTTIAEYILGSIKKHDLQTRVLNAATFCTFVVGALLVIADIFEGSAYHQLVLGVFAAIANGVLHLFGRLRPGNRLLPWMFLIINCLVIFYDWMFIGGLTGASLLIALTISVVLPFIFLKRYVVWAWGGLACLIVTLAFIEIRFPYAVNRYTDHTAHAVDLTVTVVMLGIGIALLTKLVLFSYRRQQEQIVTLNKKLKKKNKQLKEALETKDKFFSIIAHDLRGPLGNLQQLGEFLWQYQDEIDDQERNELLEGINKSAKGTFSLLDNLLKWARANSGQMVFQPVDIDIRELISKNFSIYNAKGNSKGINLTMKAEEGLMVHADYEMLNTVIRNLISNAVKYTPSGGEVGVSVKSLNPGKVLICVSDTGIGIKPEVLPHIFRVDSRHTTTGTANEKGSGLGLKLCKEFVQKNKGKIWAESKKGKGSKFWVELHRA